MSADYNRAMDSIRKGLTKHSGGQAAENAASTAYQAMVAQGEASQIKLKYRSGKAHKQVRR